MSFLRHVWQLHQNYTCGSPRDSLRRAISLCVYTYEVNKNLCLRGSGYLIADDSSRQGLPEAGDNVGDFALEYIDEYVVFRLNIGSALYKYMRMYLWTALRIKDFTCGSPRDSLALPQVRRARET